MQTNNSKEKVRQLQNKLYLTAKKCDSRRFHALYDKVYRDDVLFEAWKRVKANKGSSGVDGIGIEDIEEMGIEKYLSEIKSELMDGKYKPSPVKRVMIPKPDGSERPLGIPTVKDRIVQMATKIAIEPVFEADFRDCSYGFRPKRSARQALEVVRKACNNKGYYVVDADIEKFFDNVNQDKLMKLVEQRISDRRILKLIRQWLVSGVLYGNVLTISELGTSQGSVISPLLANIYLNTLDRLWEKYGLTHGILVRYADDTVIICKNKKNADHALNLLHSFSLDSKQCNFKNILLIILEMPNKYNLLFIKLTIGTSNVLYLFISGIIVTLGLINSKNSPSCLYKKSSTSYFL